MQELCESEKRSSEGLLCDGQESVFFLLTLFLCVFRAVPDEPPVILAVKPTTTTSVLVQWKVFSDF